MNNKTQITYPQVMAIQAVSAAAMTGRVVVSSLSARHYYIADEAKGRFYKIHQTAATVNACIRKGYFVVESRVVNGVLCEIVTLTQAGRVAEAAWYGHSTEEVA